MKTAPEDLAINGGEPVRTEPLPWELPGAHWIGRAEQRLVGQVIKAHIHQDALRSSDVDDGELIRSAPLLAYLEPGRFARVEDSFAFPFPKDFSR